MEGYYTMNKSNINAYLKSTAAALLFKVPVSDNGYLNFIKSAKHEQMAAIMNRMSQPSLYRMQRRIFNDCERVQRTILYEILRANENTKFGKKHHFSKINGIKGFRKCVPITEWNDYAEDMISLEKGEADVLFPGKTEYFYLTSGSTGTSKHIPESSRDTVVREVVGKLKNLEKAVACDIMEEFLSHNIKVFALTSTLSSEYTEGGIPIGSASGRTASIESGKSSDLMAFPATLANYYSGDDFFYMSMRAALFYSNITIIMGNNAAFMENIIKYGEAHAEELINDIRSGGCKLDVPDEVRRGLKNVFVPAPERADELETLFKSGKFIPKYYWPDMKAASFWLSGSVGTNVEQLRPLLSDKVKFMDLGYGSSEAKINIPLEAETSAGALLTYTCFYEFIPVDGGEPIMAHEVVEGQDYEILLTTNSGLYRYRIHDIVHIDGFVGNTPLLHFTSKAGDIANLAQEKLYGSILRSLICDAAAERFTVKTLQVYPDPEQRKYIIYIEPVSEVTESTKIGLSELIDSYMRKENMAYDLIRGWALNMLEVRIMPRGWGELVFDEYAKGKPNRSQVKVPVVRKSPYTGTEDN